MYPCSGTIFEKSTTPLWKWFYAMYLFTTTRHGVPAKELERQLGVTYKCAWRMAHEIRKLMGEMDVGGLFGDVEVDETYIGGKRPGKRGRGADGKTVVVGMKQRKDPVKTQVVPNAKTKTIEPIVRDNVRQGSSVHTDEWQAYKNLIQRGYDHQSVNHGKKEWVRGDCHTNSIEGYWSRLKLSIRGTHVHVSERHLSKYLAEFDFRHNLRESPDRMFSFLVDRLQNERPV
ncbi:MAG: IS1595 family transposase [Roseovarius sp.]|nr:IS1595 family transposase [Roseovarius sp.]